MNRADDTISYLEESLLGVSVEAEAAALTADYATEARLRAGDVTLGSPVIESTGERDAILQAVGSLGSIWPVPPLERLTPYDERIYRNLLHLQESNQEDLDYKFSELLIDGLINDGPYLDNRLVQDLVTLALTCSDGVFNGTRELAALAFRCPFLLDDLQFLHAVTDVADIDNALTFLMLQKLQAQHPHPALTETLSDPAKQFPSLEVNAFTATPDLVHELARRNVPSSLINDLLRHLAEFEEIGWRGVEPSDLARLIQGQENIDPDPIEKYVAYRRSIGTPEEDLAELT